VAIGGLGLQELEKKTKQHFETYICTPTVRARSQ